MSRRTRYVTENDEISSIMSQKFRSIINFFKIASKYSSVIAFVSSCTYIAIILTSTYAFLLLKVLREIFLDSRSFLLKSLRNGGGRGKGSIVTKRDMGGGGRIRRFLAVRTY